MLHLHQTGMYLQLRRLEPLSCGTEGLLVVLGFGEKIDSEDRQESGLREEQFLFWGGIIGFYVLSSFRKKKSEFFY